MKFTKRLIAALAVMLFLAACDTGTPATETGDSSHTSGDKVAPQEDQKSDETDEDSAHTSGDKVTPTEDPKVEDADEDSSHTSGDKVRPAD